MVGSAQHQIPTQDIEKIKLLNGLLVAIRKHLIRIHCWSDINCYLLRSPLGPRKGFISTLLEDSYTQSHPQRQKRKEN
jgi:hypothetical protein